MKRSRIFLLGIGGLLIAGGIAYGVTVLANQALGPQTETAQAPCADNTPTNNHIVTIADGALSMNDIHASLCDTLTIINADDTMRLIAFGVHDSHKTYNGVTEQVLQKDQHMQVTLTQIGHFTFHDHLHDDFLGSFEVK